MGLVRTEANLNLCRFEGQQGFIQNTLVNGFTVHVGLQWVIYIATLVYAYIELVQESLQRRFWTDRRNTSSYDSACPSSVKFSRTLFRPAFAFFKR